MIYFSNSRELFRLKIRDFKIPKALADSLVAIKATKGIVGTDEADLDEKHCNIFFNLKNNILFNKSKYVNLLNVLGGDKYFIQEQLVLGDRPIIRFCLKSTNRAKLFKIASQIIEILKTDKSVINLYSVVEMPLKNCNNSLQVVNSSIEYYETRITQFLQVLLSNANPISGLIELDERYIFDFNYIQMLLLYAITEKERSYRIVVYNMTPMDRTALCNNIVETWKENNTYIPVKVLLDKIELGVSSS